jgi:hypothetical protein
MPARMRPHGCRFGSIFGKLCPPWASPLPLIHRASARPVGSSTNSVHYFAVCLEGGCMVYRRSGHRRELWYTRAIRGNGDIRGSGTSPYHGSRKSKNFGAGVRTEIAIAAHAEWTRGGSRISTGEKPTRRTIELRIGGWLQGGRGVERSFAGWFRFEAGSGSGAGGRGGRGILVQSLSMPICRKCEHGGREHNWVSPACSRCGNRSPSCPFCFQKYQQGRKRGQCQHPGCGCGTYSPLTDQARPVNKYAGRLMYRKRT